ncbi:MAG: DUF1566 domain-containing protein [Alphaproteobacteria bacterium]|nr:DUF1566 domain-containing protein [Alphaproteobacteria bacterium]
MNYLIIQLFSFLLYSQSGRGGIYRYASTTLLCLLISGFCLSTPAYAACSNPVKDAGDIIYNSDYHVPQYCDGTIWRAMGRAWTGASGGGCTDPVGVEGKFVYNIDYAVPQYCDSYIWRAMSRPANMVVSFTNRIKAALDSTITSNTVVLQGGWTDRTVTCGAGCTAISINGGAFVAGPVTGVDGGDTIAIRQTSSGSGLTTTTALVTVGTTTSAVWYVTTKMLPGYVMPDGTLYVGLSPDGNVPMYTTPCDIGMSGTQFNCTGTRTNLMWGTHGELTGYDSLITGEANTTGLVANYGSYDDGYVIGVPAAQACADLVFGGRDDWYLPARYELNLFWLAPPAAIGGLDTTGYTWYRSSSGEQLGVSTWATVQDFSDGDRGSFYKKNEHFVRCVRK